MQFILIYFIDNITIAKFKIQFIIFLYTLLFIKSQVWFRPIFWYSTKFPTISFVLSISIYHRNYHRDKICLKNAFFYVYSLFYDLTKYYLYSSMWSLLNEHIIEYRHYSTLCGFSWKNVSLSHYDQERCSINSACMNFKNETLNTVHENRKYLSSLWT